MSDNIGVLGSSSAIVTGTATAYTCPTNKGAKVKIMYAAQADTNSTLAILVNGCVVATVGAMTANHYTWSAAGAGVAGADSATAPTGASAAQTVAPADQIYYLSAGDTIQYTVGTLALKAMNFQVVGVEIDLTP